VSHWWSIVTKRSTTRGRAHDAEGGVLLSAHCDTSEQIDRAKAILKQTGATDIASAGEETVGATPSSRDTTRL